VAGLVLGGAVLLAGCGGGGSSPGAGPTRTASRPSFQAVERARQTVMSALGTDPTPS